MTKNSNWQNTIITKLMKIKKTTTDNNNKFKFLEVRERSSRLTNNNKLDIGHRPYKGQILNVVLQAPTNCTAQQGVLIQCLQNGSRLDVSTAK